MRAWQTLCLTGLLFLVACTPGPSRDCACLPCEADNALNLSVIDAESADAVTTFVVELVLDGQAQGEPELCSAAEREGSNSCSFGNATGYYHLILSAPGYEQREMAVRYAGEGGGICCDACLQPQNVIVELTPRS